MTNIIPVNGTPGLEVVESEYIAVKPLCDSLGIHHTGQYEKLKEKSWATVEIISTVGADGKTREMFSLHKDSVPMWLATINENKVKPEVRATLIAYQKEAAKALNDYFTKGVAVNTNIITDYEKQMKIIAMAKGFIADDRLASKMEVVISRAMGETPQIAPQDVPLYVENYLAEKNRLDVNSGGFGRKLASLFRKEFDKEPPIEHAEVRGRLRTVKAYKESHRYLFDQVLETYK